MPIRTFPWSHKVGLNVRPGPSLAFHGYLGRQMDQTVNM